MQHLNLSQQDRIFDPAIAKPVVVIGAGSVGGWVVLHLASIGCQHITVWDGDFVSSHNVPMSVYGRKDVGMLKVRALERLVEDKTGMVIQTVPKMYEGETLSGSLVMCVDWMDERKRIWERVNDNPNVDVMVDTRVANEFVAVHAINPCDENARRGYELLLYPSSEAAKPTCGEHGIIYVAQLAASAAVVCLTGAWKGDRKERHFRMRVDDLRQVTP